MFTRNLNRQGVVPTPTYSLRSTDCLSSGFWDWYTFIKAYLILVEHIQVRNQSSTNIFKTTFIKHFYFKQFNHLSLVSRTIIYLIATLLSNHKI